MNIEVAREALRLAQGALHTALHDTPDALASPSRSAVITRRIAEISTALAALDWLPMNTAPRCGRKVLLTNGKEVALAAWDAEANRAAGGGYEGAWAIAYHPSSGWCSDEIEAPTGWQEPPAP